MSQADPLTTLCPGRIGGVDERAVRAQDRSSAALAIANQRHTMAALWSRRRPRVLRSLDDHLGSVEEYFLGERLHLLRTGSGTG